MLLSGAKQTLSVAAFRLGKGSRMSTATSLIGEERLAGCQTGPVLMDLFSGIATEGTALLNMADIDGATESEIADAQTLRRLSRLSRLGSLGHRWA